MIQEPKKKDFKIKSQESEDHSIIEHIGQQVSITEKNIHWNGVENKIVCLKKKSGSGKSWIDCTNLFYL